MASANIDTRHASTSESTGFTVHDYVDILEKQKRQYDAFFALKSWRPTPELHPETTKSITDKIINSPRMKDTIQQVLVFCFKMVFFVYFIHVLLLQLLQEGNSSYENLIAQAKSILEEMGHTYSFGTVRVLGYFLSKLMRQLYQGVAINNHGVLKVLNLSFKPSTHLKNVLLCSLVMQCPRDLYFYYPLIEAMLTSCSYHTSALLWIFLCLLLQLEWVLDFKLLAVFGCIVLFL